MNDVTISYWAVLVAALINMAVGAIWYSQAMFAQQWSELIGRKMTAMRANAGPGYGVALVAALVQAFVLAHFVQYAGASGIISGAETGLVAWLGFVATTSAANTVFAGRPWKLWAIDAGYFLVVLVINGAVLAIWT